MLRTAILLGLISAVGPFAIDFYLPALPTLTAALGATAAEGQRTLTAYFIGFGLSQLVYGPLADQNGRKPPLYLGLAIFALGTLGCYLAGDITQLTTARLIQGLGGAAVMVIPRAIVRDRYRGNEATRLMALIMLVISVSPMLAPLAGSFLIEAFGWRSLFLLLLLTTVASLLLIHFLLEETLPVERRIKVNVASMLSGGKALLTDRAFLALTLVGAFGFSSFFLFIASAPFVYVEQFGLTPRQFSYAFAVNALGFFAASQMASPLGQRLGMLPLIRLATVGFFLMTLVLLLLTVLLGPHLWLLIALLFLANACLGLVIPSAMVLALEGQGERAGLASSLGGTLQMLIGAAVVSIAALFFDGKVGPMVAAIALCGLLALLSLGLAGRAAQGDHAPGAG